jgi:transposase
MQRIAREMTNTTPTSNTRTPSLPKMSGGVALAQVRSAVEALTKEGRHDDAIEFSLAALAAVLEKSSEMELMLLKLRRERAGKRSEQTNSEQLALLIDQMMQESPETEMDPVQEAEYDEALKKEIEAAEKENPTPLSKRSQWRASEKVKHNVHYRHVPAEEKTCSDCGRDKKLIGVDVTSSIKFIPAHLEVDDFELEKFACGYCKNGVTTAEGPKRVIVKRSADSSLLAHVVVSKYADHTPLTRQSRIFERGGAQIPVSTMADWVDATADFVMPIVEALEKRVRNACVIGTDATGLKVLEPRSADNIVKGTMWCYVGDGKDVLFKYAPTGDGETGPWDFLRGRDGYVQADAASVFDRVFNGSVANAVEVGCWAHARRKFVSLQETDVRVAYPLQLIARLYRIETLADTKRLSPKERALMRRERSLPVLEKLKRTLAASLPNEPPSSELAKASRYILNHWDALTRFIDDGRLLLDNNVTEQQMRDIALGRKNYLFAGSHDAAHRAAALYSLMRTCAQHGVAPYAYLSDVMHRLVAKVPVEDLLPDRWQLLFADEAGK